MRRIRDQRLLDALERSERTPYAGRVWRSVREGQDPLTCWRAGGRWDDGTLDVLYTSETKAAAVAERQFHLYQGQPLPPSKIPLRALRTARFPQGGRAIPRPRVARVHRVRCRFIRAVELPRARTGVSALTRNRRGVCVPGSRRSAGPERPQHIFEQSDRVLRTRNACRHGGRHEPRIPRVPANVSIGPRCPHRRAPLGSTTSTSPWPPPSRCLPGFAALTVRSVNRVAVAIVSPDV